MRLLKSTNDAVAILLAGGVGVLPTDTVYGLVACARDRNAVNRMYALKHRERKPGTVIAANVEQLHELGLSGEQISAISHWWPAPLSITVKPTQDTFGYLHQGLGDFPVRIPADKRLRAIVLKTGPLATSSANLPGETPAGTVEEAFSYFGEQPDFYVDGGDLSNRPPSTIARITEDGLQIIREGAFEIPAKDRAA